MAAFDDHFEYIDQHWRELTDVGPSFDGYETVAEEFLGQGHWSSDYRMVTSVPDGQLVAWTYGGAATDMQEDAYYGIEGYVHRKTEMIERVYFE